LNLTEEEVRHALRTLEDDDLVAVEHSSRVEKYEHRIRTVLDLRRDETALLCLLFLRGPQTPGELRSRSDRLFNFDGLDAVESTLARMTAIPENPAGDKMAPRPLAVMLPRQPGSREARYTHLLGGPVDIAVRAATLDPPRPSETSVRIAALESQVAAMHAEVASLRAAVEQMQSKLNAQ
jgi:hypothetical protein